MQKGEYVLVEFTGKEKDTKKVFETTNEETAKKGGIFEEGKLYAPIAAVVGEGDFLKGIEDALLEMDEGEQKKLTISPEDAFGERNPEKVGIVMMKEFQKRNINPFPGLPIEINGGIGRVQSVSGGRVRVDFNHELAGKTVEYEIKIAKKLKTLEEKAGEWAKKLIPSKETSLKITEGKATITMPKMPEKETELVQKIATAELKKRFPELKEIEYKAK